MARLTLSRQSFQQDGSGFFDFTDRIGSLINILTHGCRAVFRSVT
jgi:hypothetical protein